MLQLGNLFAGQGIPNPSRSIIGDRCDPGAGLIENGANDRPDMSNELPLWLPRFQCPQDGSGVFR